MIKVFSHQCISALEKANGILGRLRPKVLCIGTVKTHIQPRKKIYVVEEIGLLCLVLCSPRNSKTVSFQRCGVSLLAHVRVAAMWLSSWQCPAALAANFLWQASDWNHQISAFPAVTQNNFKPTLLFNYLRLISVPGTWWYSFSVSKHIFTSSLFVVLATLYLCAFTVLFEILLCDISSAIIMSGECLSLASGTLQHFCVFLRINACPTFDKPSGCWGMLYMYVVFVLKRTFRNSLHPT